MFFYRLNMFDIVIYILSQVHLVSRLKKQLHQHRRQRVFVRLLVALRGVDLGWFLDDALC
jgi:hypothetical protein